MALDLKPAPLTAGVDAYFEKCREKLGFVPNVLTAYAHDMAKLEAFMAFYNDLMLGPSGLSRLEREMIAVAVSSHNRCFYCLTAHGAAVRQLSGLPELGEAMVMNWRAVRLPPRQQAMLAFAEKMTLDSARIVESDRQALREAGFSDREILGTSPPSPPFSRCPIAWPRRSTCGQTRTITRRRADRRFFVFLRP